MFYKPCVNWEIVIPDINAVAISQIPDSKQRYQTSANRQLGDASETPLEHEDHTGFKAIPHKSQKEEAQHSILGF